MEVDPKSVERREEKGGKRMRTRREWEEGGGALAEG
jgi:hypothetical protein